jgi:hypothetical protein
MNKSKLDFNICSECGQILESSNNNNNPTIKTKYISCFWLSMQKQLEEKKIIIAQLNKDINYYKRENLLESNHNKLTNDDKFINSIKLFNNNKIANNNKLNDDFSNDIDKNENIVDEIDDIDDIDNIEDYPNNSFWHNLCFIFCQ